jgi:hypothetical protein
MLHVITIVAILLACALAIAAATIDDYGHPVAEYVAPKFPSHIELAVGATVILSFAVAGWMMAGLQ